MQIAKNEHLFTQTHTHMVSLCETITIRASGKWLDWLDRTNDKLA